MRAVVDLHLHSRYSNSTSASMDLPSISAWAHRKGVDLLGTGDCTHPDWLDALASKLREAGDGAYTYGNRTFLVTGEVSLVWRQEGRGRRIHLLMVLPSLHDARRIHTALRVHGNLAGDGRPILKMSAQEFSERVWAESPEAMLIPAHIWTPWYSVLGAKSGFDTLEGCFGMFSDRIVAVETGLSSDPPMNRRVSALDRLRLVSFSDAHSPRKLAREATVLDLESFSYAAVARALETGAGYVGTLEFYPEEGKYHYDGHRKCKVRMSPEQSKAVNGRCPVCGRDLTMGVLHRVIDLADRQESLQDDGSFQHLIPLDEIIGQALHRRLDTQAVARTYDVMVERFGSEIEILLDRSLDELAAGTPDAVLEGIARVRAGDVCIAPGYDGVFGEVAIAFGEPLAEAT